MPKEFSQFDMGEGTRAAKRGKRAKQNDGRRTPRRDKQTARGVGMHHVNPEAMMTSVRGAMKRGRHRAPK